MIFLWLFVLFTFLFILLKSADYFVDNAEILGNKFQIPSFVLGATVIAFGTSLPELAVSISALLNDAPEIISGTVIGSNVSNIFFILGFAIVIGKGFKLNFKENAIPLLVLLFVSLLAARFLWDNHFSVFEGLVCVILLFLYVVYIVFYQKTDTDQAEENLEMIERSTTKTLIIIGLSGFGIWLGAEMVIHAIEKVADLLNIKKDVISLSIVALGTSLPELAVTIVAVRKKRYKMVLGNIVGSNIFNLLCVLGIPVLIGYFTNNQYIIENNVFINFSIPVMIFATITMLIISILNYVNRGVGIIFISLYVLFIVGIFLKIDLFSLLLLKFV